MTATLWYFDGLFFGGDVDTAGTEIGDICTGSFVTCHESDEQAAIALAARYEGLRGRFELRRLIKCPDSQTTSRKIKTVLRMGGTKKCPLL